MEAISYFTSAIYNSSLLLCPVVIIYWFLKAGCIKQQLRLAIVAANWVMLIAGTLYGIKWITETYTAWFSGEEYEQYALLNRMTGPYWCAYWSMLCFSLLIPQLLWFRKIRNSTIAAFMFPLLLNYGLLFERFVIVITSLHRDYLPSSWMMFHPFSVSGVQMGIYVALTGGAYLVFRRRKEKRVVKY